MLVLAACARGDQDADRASAAGQTTVVAAGRLARLPAGNTSDSPADSSAVAPWAEADRPYRFEFPRDHGPHPEFRQEWWYLTGNLRDATGARYGFELTFFRLAAAPVSNATAGAATPASTEERSKWHARQVYVAHFALTDVTSGRFHSTARYARDALGLAGSSGLPLRVWLSGWFLAEAAGTAAWTLHAADGEDALTLTLQPQLPPVLNGDEGLSVKSDEPGAASYYYSIPRLEARGELRHAGRSLSVSGLAWLDREWGSGPLGAAQQGWDWFGLQLADGTALMFYALRTRAGERDPHSAGTWITSDGSTRALRSGDVEIRAESHWTSPRGDRYPSRWRIRIPSLALDLDVAPAVPDQELDTTPRYWEGSVRVAGERSGRSVGGQGYVELVGYAR
jgi:predicted secreted hydrolase